MKLTLVRHGQTEENANKIVQGHNHGTLSEKGLKQVKELAKRLKDDKFDYIYSSDLKRCTDTAEEIRRYHPDTPFKTTEKLREMSFGSFHGKPSAEIDWDSLPGTFYTKRPGGGETIEKLGRRVISFLHEVLAQHPNDHILFITHGGPMRIIKHYVEGGMLHELFEETLDNCAILQFEIKNPVEYKVTEGNT